MGLYYKRSKNTTSVREIIKDYLLLYCNMMGTLKDELNEFETNKPLELPNLRSINLKDIELLIKIKDFYIYLLDGYHSFVLNQIISQAYAILLISLQ